MDLTINHLIDRLSDLHIVVIGDVMWDEYYKGEVKRISPEKSIPILENIKYEGYLGGAANVAFVLKSLGVGKVTLATISHIDKQKHVDSMFMNELNMHGIKLIVHDDIDAPLIIKSRYETNDGQAFLRVDHENTKYVSLMNERMSFFEKLMLQIEWSTVDGIIYQDYDKGSVSYMLTSCFKQKLTENNYSIPIYVDPKNDFGKFYQCDIFKPNLKEFMQHCGIKKIDLNAPNSKTMLIEGAKNIITTFGHSRIIVTLGAAGLFTYSEKDGATFIKNNDNVDVIDVCGAGDSIISLAAALFSHKLGKLYSPTKLYEIINAFGGIIVSTPRAMWGKKNLEKLKEYCNKTN